VDERSIRDVPLILHPDAEPASRSSIGLTALVRASSALRSRLRSRLSLAGIPPGHEAGLQPKTVQTFVGHATLQMTMDTYGHMFPSDDHAKAMDAIAEVLFT
jgi:integrase